MGRPRSRIALSFVGAALTLAVGAAGWIAIRTLDVATEFVQHTVVVLDGFQDLFESVLDAESSQRGYLLTGDEQYLAPYRSATGRMRADLYDLRRLTSKNQRQQRRLDSLSTAIDDKADELGRTIELRRMGDVAGALGIVRTDRGMRAMGVIRRTLAAAEDEEHALFIQRSAARDRARRIVLLIIVPGAIAACVVMFVAVRRAQRELEAERSTNEDLERQSTQLQDQAAELEMQSTELERQFAESRQLASELERTNATLAETAESAKRSQRMAELAEEHLSRLIEQAPVAIAITRGPEFVFELANPRFQALVGDRWLVGHPIRAALPEIVEQGLLQVLESTYRSGTPYVGTEEALNFARGKDGVLEHGVFDVVYQPLRGRLDEVYGLAIVATEVTEEVREQQAIERLRSAADVASRAKSEFIASMSHELRTPLNAIIGYESLLRQGFVGSTTPKQDEFLERIRTSADHLLGLIEDVLSLSRIEAGQIEIRWSTIDAHAALKDAAAMVEPQAAAKRLNLVLEPVAAPIMLVTDRKRLGQCLINLASNAVKYTDVGEVTMRVHRDDGMVVFDISDTGLGISPDHMSKIFDAFWQVEQSTTRRVGGAGLGLSVTHRLAGLLGGTVTARSELGVGSRFSLRLPQQQAGLP